MLPHSEGHRKPTARARLGTTSLADPGHFVRWLGTQGVTDAADSFVPRSLYGRYLREALWPRGQDRSADIVGTVHGEAPLVGGGANQAEGAVPPARARAES